MLPSVGGGIDLYRHCASKSPLLACALAGALVIGHWSDSRIAYAATPVLSETAPVGVPSSATKVLSGDFHGDGVPDLIVAIGGSPRNPGYLLLYIGSPTGQYSLINTSYSYTGAFADMAVGDFNGDGKLDVAVFSNSWEIHQQSVHVFLGTGSTTAPFSHTDIFSAADRLPDSNGYSGTMVAGDFNGDGVTDLAVTTNQRRSITLLLGARSVPFVLQQAPGFTLPEQSSVISRLAVGDFDHNGSPDLALTYRVS